MTVPSAVTLASILRTALGLVERSTDLPSSSPAVAKFRTSALDLIAELESAARREPRSDLFELAREDFYRKQG